MIRAVFRASGPFLAILLGVAAGIATLAATADAKPPEPALSSVGAPPLTSIPTGKGLPVVVRTGLFVNHVESFDDNKGTFEATTDLRLTWFDTRLRYPAEEGLHGYKEYRASAAEEELARIWTPRIRHLNRVGEPSFIERRLRLFPNGMVEVIARTTAVYKVTVDTTKFPFDRQALPIELMVHEDTVETVDMDFTSDDVSFSRVAKSVEIGGWTPGLVRLNRDLVKGWNGDRYAKVAVMIDVGRVAVESLSTIFIPLFASLLIPFLATWMNKAVEGEFEVEAFELGNVIIGGLFAVIALSFTISSAFPALMAGDNTVTRLLALNYVALAVGTIITVVFYRYRLPATWFGPYVQEQAFGFLSWAFPVLFIATGVAFVMIAAA
ncbi:hypothetical protein [Magnetospirillum sp. SS-4]|uniref:hypothetical protein n=1 Tax=Magnetospirillum sp. SS-4 TaxID=2681465 RepID=UPI00137C8B98|nr:hypothetical protein [Magnetospirillum sp. SS-4]CAA7616537.1 Glycine receptor, alpha 4 subunit [Magnetospirillum sp. SS-4]